MSYKDHFPLQCGSREMKVMRGRVTFGGSGAIDTTLSKGKRYTWSRTSAGLYVITLDDVYPELDGVNFTLFQAAATAGHCLQVTAETVATTKTITILYQENNAGTFAAADIASGSKLGFTLWLRNVRDVS